MSEDLNQYQDNQPQSINENGGSEHIFFNQELNNNQINNGNLSKKNGKSFHQIFSEEENKNYILKFSSIGNNLKILLSEQDNFPAKTYEVLLALEELKLKNDLFTIYSSTKELSEILNTNENNNINFNIKRKSVNILALTLIFPKSEEYSDNDIEIDLTENIIDDREMFRQLFEKYKSIQQEQNEDIEQFMNRIAKIEEILTPHEVKQNNENEKEENKGEENCEEKEKSNENVEEKKIEVEKKIEDDKISEVKSSNKASKKSIQKGKNEKKGNFGKKEKFEKKEAKGKKNQKKKNFN